MPPPRSMTAGGGIGMLVRLWRFGLVGAIATAVHVGIGLGLHRGPGLSPLWANGLAFSVAVVVSFLGQARLTFPEAAAGRRAFGRFVAAALAGFGLNQSIVWAVTVLLGGPYWAALVIVLASVPALSFCAMRFWAFRT